MISNNAEKTFAARTPSVIIFLEKSLLFFSEKVEYGKSPYTASSFFEKFSKSFEEKETDRWLK